jgi:hypothetical protein
VRFADTKTGAREGQERLWVIQANAGGESGVAYCAAATMHGLLTYQLSIVAAGTVMAITGNGV